MRVPAKALTVGLVLVAGWIASEGFSPHPIIPTKGDVPTIGHGSTQYEDGRRVTMADPPIDRQRARELAMNLLEQKYGKCVRDSLGDTPVHPEEFNQAVDFSGNFGCGWWLQSSMLRKTRQADYVGACHAYLAFKFQDGRDCSLPLNWGPQGCKGVWTRQLKRHAACMAVQ